MKRGGQFTSEGSMSREELESTVRIG